MSRELLFTMVTFYSLVVFVPLALGLMYWRPRLWHYLFALFLGIIVGWFDLNTSEPQLSILLLFALSAFFGFAQPRQPWRWAALLAAWVPLGALLALTIGLRTMERPDAAGALLALVPALVGAYGGALVSRAAAREARRARSAN